MSVTFPAGGRHCDVLVVGAGPAGLSLALSLAALGLHVAVVERQDQAAIAAPRDDGREIALTHGSMRILRAFGAAEGWGPEEAAPIRAAQVLNGRSARFLDFRAGADGCGPLGWLVANHRIRRALYRCARAEPRIELLCGRRIVEQAADARRAALRTEADGWLTASLLVAADSRHSETRRALGISARMQDFGRTMLVMRAAHTRPHAGAALEWFDHGHTIAALPLHGERSSIVLTVPAARAERLAALAPAQFEQRLNRWLSHRLGALRLCSGIHRYPLVAVYADRFVGPRFALVGDAAVGMHPVTAHGFNFGLSGQGLLSAALAGDLRAGRAIGSDSALALYQRQHRRRTWPLYHATNAIARLYSGDSSPARLAREVTMGLGARIAPFRRAVVRELRS